MKISTAIFFSLLTVSLATSCSSLRKSTLSKSSGDSRDIASIPKKSGRIAKNSVDLLKMLQNGQAVVTKAVYFKDEKPFCTINIKGQRRFVPQFTAPAPSDFPSSVTFRQTLPSCGINERAALASNIKGFVPEGTQVAAVVSGTTLIVGGGACAVGTIEQIVKHLMPRKSNIGDWYTIFATLSGLTGAGYLGEGAHQLARGAGKIPILGRVVGAVTLGYLACGNAAGYVIETWIETDN